jgi:glutathione S-transferase
MTLSLYYHPLASFCHKVLIALYERGIEFEGHIVDLMDTGEHARYLELWPVGKMPVLHDEAREQTIPETSIIIEYLDQHYPGAAPMLPEDPELRLEARLWDRFYDLHVHSHLQKIVLGRIRPEGERDPRGVADARDALMTAYRMIDQRMAGRQWAVGDQFSIADCAAAPALFYVGIVEPFPENYGEISAYFERLVARPSFKRVLKEAQPYFHMFPYKEAMPARFLGEDTI